MLSLLLPSFGSMAAGVAVTEPCPMMSMSRHSVEMMQAPCCQDMDHASGLASKSPCKPGQECKTGGMLLTLVVKTFAPIHPIPSVLQTPPVIEREPANLWRPPRYL
ncbi:hypothetical protein [Pseudomonas sp. NA-150]|uniref:hypothetical protein n=1 Tax=Pseudomonas sp. NA-150 TaxID=3367525 RepID=UPI0037C914E9